MLKWSTFSHSLATTITLLLLSCSHIAGARGQLLIRDGDINHTSIALIPVREDKVIYIKTPPTTGLLRVIGEKGVILPSQQFNYDSKSGLFSWAKKSKYPEFLALGATRNRDFEVIKIAVSGFQTGLQESIAIYYDPSIFTLPLTIVCKDKEKNIIGVGYCSQLKGSEFTVKYRNDEDTRVTIAISGCGLENVFDIDPNGLGEIKYTVSNCYSSIGVATFGESSPKLEAIVASVEERVESELTEPIRNGSSVIIGYGSTTIQCGTKKFLKKSTSILTIAESCSGKDVYQWDESGKFLFSGVDNG